MPHALQTEGHLYTWSESAAGIIDIRPRRSYDSQLRQGDRFWDETVQADLVVNRAQLAVDDSGQWKFRIGYGPWSQDDDSPAQVLLCALNALDQDLNNQRAGITARRAAIAELGATDIAQQ